MSRDSTGCSERYTKHTLFQIAGILWVVFCGLLWAAIICECKPW